MDKLVSIIIPVYRVEEYLRMCLESCVRQTYKNIEIIIVNDQSDDSSMEIAREFARRDERIFIINKRHGGLSSTRNVGLEFVRGSVLRRFVESEMTGARKNEVEELYSQPYTSIHERYMNKESVQHLMRTMSNAADGQENVQTAAIGLEQKKKKTTHPRKLNYLSSNPAGYKSPFYRQYPIFVQHVPLVFKRDFLACRNIFLYNKNFVVIAGKLSALHGKRRPYISGPFSYEDVQQWQTLQERHIHSNLTSVFDCSNYKITKEIQEKIKFVSHNEIFFDDECITRYIKSYLPEESIIHYIDSDDFMEERCIETCIKAMDENTELVFHDFKPYYDGVIDYTAVRSLPKHKRNFVPVPTNSCNKKIKLKYGEVNVSGLTVINENERSRSKGCLSYGWHGQMKGSLINKIRLRFIHLIEMEDVNFGVLIFFYAEFVKTLGEQLIYYRMRKNSIMDHQPQGRNTPIYDYMIPLRESFATNLLVKKYYKEYCRIFCICDAANIMQKDSRFEECLAITNVFSHLTDSIPKVLEYDPLDSKSILTLLKVQKHLKYESEVDRYLAYRLIEGQGASTKLIKQYMRWRKIKRSITLAKKTIRFVPKIFTRPKTSMTTMIRITHEWWSSGVWWSLGVRATRKRGATDVYQKCAKKAGANK